MASQSPSRIIEPPYFSNWADQFFPIIANKLLPVALRIPGLTPNAITLFSFLLYVLGCGALFINFPNHLYFSAALLPMAYILDCMDGQFARTKGLSSALGDYLDKTLDVFKIYILTLSLSLAEYIRSGSALYLLLGFTACFAFNFRYYIKLETIFSSVNRDKDYLEKSRSLRLELYEKWENKGWIEKFLFKNRSIIFIDEAEFVVITSIAAIFNRLDIALWIFAIVHSTLAIFRLFERGYQISTNSKNLLKPMRK